MNPMQKNLRELMLARAEHLEMFAAAFVKRVGHADAEDYSLVEKRSSDGRVTTWTFVRTEDIVSLESPWAGVDE